jgi:hypothetical protein
VTFIALGLDVSPQAIERLRIKAAAEETMLFRLETRETSTKAVASIGR